MSAPETNVERQKRRHWPVIVGICAAALISTIAFLGFLSTDESEREEPVSTATN